MSAVTGTHAVVIGSSIGGILAARALRGHVDRVTLVDRDELPLEPVTRGAVPQGRHTHGLLGRGREIIEEMFPGTTADLVARGASSGDLQETGSWCFPDGTLATGPSGIVGLAVGRPLLEWYLRHRLLEDPAVEVLQRTSVLDLALVADESRVDGVIVADRDGGEPRLLPADLVVDASGRTSRTPEWIERRGYAVPPDEVRRLDKHYATRTFRRDPADGAPVVTAVVSLDPTARSGIMLAQEGERWTVSLAGTGASGRPPLDLPGFTAFAATLGSPAIAERLAGLHPLDDGASYRFPANRRRRYERLDRFPEGLVVTGDALCAFDPVFGQGMTVAALEAHELGACLVEGRTGLAARFHRRAAAHIDTPWGIAVGAAPAPVRAYQRRLLAAAAHDTTLTTAFLRVNNLLDPPTALMRPAVLWRVARGSVRARRLGGGGRPEQRVPGDATVVRHPRHDRRLDQRPAAHQQPHAG